MKKSIYYFRNDLRVEDNIGFINCYNDSEYIIPIYIFQNNIHKDYILNILHRFNFNIHIFFGNPINIICNLIEIDDTIDSIYFNCEYDIISLYEDNLLIQSIKKKNNNIIIKVLEDKLLSNIKSILNNNKPYTNYKKFYNKIKNYNINKPTIIELNNNKFIKLNNKHINFINTDNNNIETNNKLLNRNSIIDLLNKINNKSCLSSSKFSILLKYGIISIRELFYSLVTIIHNNKINNFYIINELYRREFYYYISYYDVNYIKKYNDIDINNDKYNLWINGNTGIPIIDAGMNQLNKINVIDNKMKIILGSYLINELKLDWKYGDYYFSQNLLDYDIILNQSLFKYMNNFNINPNFKPLNYKNQSKKYDSNCKYIKKYLPNLKNKNNIDIHNMNLNT